MREIVLDLSMIIRLNFPTLITDSFLYSTSNHVNDLLSLNAFFNLFSLSLNTLATMPFRVWKRELVMKCTEMQLTAIYLSWKQMDKLEWSMMAKLILTKLLTLSRPILVL